MAKSKRFQHKLWRIVNHCRSGAVKWSKTGDSIIFNFSKFQREYLEANDDFCKSSNNSSFIRQLNLYGFRKLVDLSRTNHSNQDEKEYVNPYFMKGRLDLLNQVVRKPLKPFVESNARVKKEILFDEDLVTQESMEGVSRNQECSRNKSNNLSIQGKIEASRRSTRKRKLNKFYMQEDTMEDEKESTPRRREWYQRNEFPIIATSDNSSSPKEAITRQFDPLHIDLEEESSGPARHDSFKTNIFSITPHSNVSSPTRISMGQIDPIGFKIKKELIDEERNPVRNDTNTTKMGRWDAERLPISYQIKKEIIEDSINHTPEQMDISAVRKKIKVSPRVEEKYRLDYKIRKEPVEQEVDDVEILFETSFKNIAASSWSDCVNSNFSPKSSRNSRVCTEKIRDSRKINFITLRKSVPNPMTFDDLLQENGILKFPEEEDVYYDKCLLENSDLEWMSKDNGHQNFDENQNGTGSLVPNEEIGRKIQFICETVGNDMNNNPKKYSPSKLTSKQRCQSAVKRKYPSDIEALCADLDKQAALRNMGKQSMSLARKMFPENRKGSCNIESFCVDMDKHVKLSHKNNESINLARKQFPENRKGFGDIESLCVGMDKHVNLSQKNNELVPKQVSTLMLAPPGPSTSKAETSSAVGNKTLVKILPPPRIEPQNIERLKIIPEQNSAPKVATMKRLEGNQPISEDALILLRKNYDEDDDPFFLHEGAKDIVLTQAIGNSRKCNLLRI